MDVYSEYSHDDLILIVYPHNAILVILPPDLRILVCIEAFALTPLRHFDDFSW